MKHTPEPWGIEETRTTLWVGPLRRDGKVNTIVTDFDVNGLIEEAEARNRADAARIVECVNACAGMADPAAEIARLRARNERMRKALERVMDIDRIPGSQMCEAAREGLHPAPEEGGAEGNETDMEPDDRGDENWFCDKDGKP